MKRIVLIILIEVQMLLSVQAYSSIPDQGTGSPPLLAGVYKVDITPPLLIPLGGYSTRKGPATGVRDPLNAVVLVFDNGQTKAAIVSLDLIQVKGSQGQQIYRAIREQAGIQAGNIIINASHTHGSPWLETDSCYSREVAGKVGGAVHAALLHMQPVTVGYGIGEVGFNVNRRSIGRDGKSHGGLNAGGLTDPRVKIVSIDPCDKQSAPLAVIFHMACHPNVFRGENTEITADFPGEAKSFIEKIFGSFTTAMFLQGCAGDIRANLPGKGNQYRNGSEADMRWCGWSAGAEVVKTVTWLGTREQLSGRQEVNQIRTASGVLKISAKENQGEVLWPREHIIDGKAHLSLKLISIGQICFVALPGEPVVGYGFKIEEQLHELGFDHVLVMGYSDGDAGYVPTKEMYQQGGYEVTESSLSPSCEQEIMAGIMELAKKMVKQEK